MKVKILTANDVQINIDPQNVGDWPGNKLLLHSLNHIS